ncbi:glycosyltransferase [Hydrogenophaga sp.]|uniref:capsular polysaccharide export protein, LipB/KpsS family n=1 Tax=Hydrogenophaga sp. TaxID=1904254 RepID=UPI0027304DE9|nr:glycosyltransferase [Hydrogenophaga sp.]MDP2073513.1 glycosyltransferase [Hydrogenophaga sp.]MDP3109431.1 glycosyltransferase [Hydrogenophaga sp.]
MSAILLAQSEEDALNSRAFDTLQSGYLGDSQDLRTLQNFQVFLSDPLPWSSGPVGKLSYFNEFLAAFKLQRLSFRDEAGPFNALNVQAFSPLQPLINGPLVTVLITSFNSAERICAAVESLQKQSWQSIELIIIDDGSTDGSCTRVKELASHDARVRPVFLERNIGTYAAKHIGLQHATGEFVTCHDSDDWSHPQKIERQVRPLIDNPDLVCTVSCWIRITDEGEFYSRLGPPYMRLNPSSPMFRRELVLQRAGAWDVVRTGADSEFLARIKAVFGEKAVLRISQPLALGSHRPGSLMTAEDTGYSAEGRSSSRQAYWDAWNQWHAAAKARGSRPWLPPNPVLAATHRMFDAPEELKVQAPAVAEAMKGHGLPGFMDAPAHRPHWLAHSSAVAQIPTLAALVGGPVLRDGRLAQRDARLAGVLAWGRKPSALRAAWRAADLRLPLLRLEDGFLRSFSTGDRSPPLSLVLDDTGIYYDSTRPSALERLLESPEDLLANSAADDVARARALIAEHGLSKYNHAPPLAQVQAGLGRPLLRATDAERVLVVDQTAGDMSIALGGASAQTFADMLAAALANHPRATVYVKTHPETASGRKGGHFAALAGSERVVLLRQAIEPLSLLREMDHVYVVSSTLGFEAVLAGKPVHCFGLPWYAGWGATVDAQRCERRTRRRSVDELFAAAYLRYARYLNPETHERGSIFDVIAWLVRQRRMAGLLGTPHA